MTTDNDLFNEEPKEFEKPDSISPGQLLKQAREAKGLTQQQVADGLRLRVVVVQFIENDEFDKLASATFVRGYLRSIGKVLEVDEKEVFAAYRAHGNEQVSPTTVQMQSFSRRKVKERNDNRLMLMSYGIIIVVIALVLIWWWQESNFSLRTITGSEDAPTEQEAQQSRENAASLPQVVRPSAHRANGRLTEEEVAAGDTSTVSVEAEQAPDVPPTIGEPQTTANPDANDSALPISESQDLIDLNTDDATEPANTAQASNAESTPVVTEPTASTEQLVFTFNEACWVKVSDASGEDIAVGVKAAGYRMPLTGEPPFDIILCRPESVDITYNGTTVNLDDYVRGRSVTLTLD
ncbi:RodZ domain-containing protein [Pseudidiomarina sp. E22-M8]|uniref:RodZ domain-containing protein n=1 Tax=Pseudidiomarina sp. E22-M8 TaxID=3424768 RepID=UPI00403C404E